MAAKNWNGIERRQADTLEHIKANASIDDIHEMLIDLKSAFPDGDFDGHRKAHEAMMKAAAAQEKFWEDVKLDFFKKGLLGSILIVGSVLLIGLWYKLHMFLDGRPPQ